MTQTRRRLSSQLLLILVLAQFQVDFSMANTQLYNAINGYLCMKSNFTLTFPGATNKIICGFHCSKMPNCQAFTISEGPCQLFVFDKCSKNVRDCNCTKRGQVFIKQQAGIQPGALCPTDFKDDMCGVKYMITPRGNWHQQLARCQAQSSNLVIFSDVMDTAEMTHVNSFTPKYGNNQYWLGGFRSPGFAPPLGGWNWVACNSSIDPSLWANSEPSMDVAENAVFRSRIYPNLSDNKHTVNLILGLCECLSPFD